MWSPIIWERGIRAQRYFKAALWCVLDFDDGQLSLDQALRLWCDSTHIIGTTKNHRLPKNGISCDRFRVAVRFERPITDLRVYRYTMTEIMQKHPCDTSCKDGARYFFPCSEIISVGDEEGYKEDVRSDVPEYFERVNKDKYREMAKAGMIPQRVKNHLRDPPKKGKRNTTVYGIGKDLAMVGWDLERTKALILQCGHFDLSAQEICRALENGHKSGLEEMSE